MAPTLSSSPSCATPACGCYLLDVARARLQHGLKTNPTSQGSPTSHAAFLGVQMAGQGTRLDQPPLASLPAAPTATLVAVLVVLASTARARGVAGPWRVSPLGARAFRGRPLLLREGMRTLSALQRSENLCGRMPAGHHEAERRSCGWIFFPTSQQRASSLVAPHIRSLLSCQRRRRSRACRCVKVLSSHSGCSAGYVSAGSGGGGGLLLD